MPTGVLINAGSVLFGGLIRGLAGNKLSENFKAQLTTVFGVCSMGMGIYSIAPMEKYARSYFRLGFGKQRLDSSSI